MLKRPFIFTLSALLALSGCGGGNSADEAHVVSVAIPNASFDQVSSSGELAHWLASEHNQGASYTFAASSDDAWSAPYSLKMYRYGTETYGALNQLVRLQPAWAGKTARLSAHLKTIDAADGGASLTLQMQGSAGEILAWNHMDNAKVKLSQPWQPYTIALKIAPQTAFISVGLMLEGAGTLWADNMALEIVD